MKNRSNPWVFMVLHGLTLCLTATLLFKEKAEPTFWINQYMNAETARFFVLVTAMAEGIFITLTVGLLLFRSYGSALLMLLNVLLITALVAFLKQVVFPEYHRPAMELLPGGKLLLAEGVRLVHLHSFPSGHTAVAFGMFVLLSSYFGGTILNLFFWICAALVGVSRVFLIQHYFIDVYFGSIIGVCIAFLLLKLEQKFQPETRWKWYNQSLLKLR